MASAGQWQAAKGDTNMELIVSVVLTSGHASTGVYKHFGDVLHAAMIIKNHDKGAKITCKSFKKGIDKQ